MGEKAWSYQHLSDVLVLAANENSKDMTLFVAPCDCDITGAKMVTEGDVTKQNTHYNLYEIKHGSAVIASVANGPDSGAGTSFVADTPQVLTATKTHVAKGETVHLNSTKTGNGLAMGRTRVALTVEVPASSAD